MAPKLRPGKGAVATIIRRYIKPKASSDTGDTASRVTVVLENEFEDEKGRRCYEFRMADTLPGEAISYYANKRYCKVVEEGDRDFFFDLGEGEGGKISWTKSQARLLLYEDIVAGVVDEPMSQEEVYAMRPE